MCFLNPHRRRGILCILVYVCLCKRSDIPNSVCVWLKQKQVQKGHSLRVPTCESNATSWNLKDSHLGSSASCSLSSINKNSQHLGSYFNTSVFVSCIYICIYIYMYIYIYDIYVYIYIDTLSILLLSLLLLLIMTLVIVMNIIPIVVFWSFLL